MMNVSQETVPASKQEEKIPVFPPDLCVTDRRANGKGPNAIGVEPPGQVRGGKRGERRRMVDPTTCERDYTSNEFEFMSAMDHYKRDNRRPFPTWSEVLEVLEALGYRKTAEAKQMPGRSATTQREGK